MLSYVHGASAKPLIGATIGEFFDRACLEHHDREALIVGHQSARLTYGRLRQEVDRLACGLLRLGLEPGEDGVTPMQLSGKASRRAARTARA